MPKYVILLVCNRQFGQKFNTLRHLAVVHEKDEAGKHLGEEEKRRFASYNTKKLGAERVTKRKKPKTPAVVHHLTSSSSSSSERPCPPSQVQPSSAQGRPPSPPLTKVQKDFRYRVTASPTRTITSSSARLRVRNDHRGERQATPLVCRQHQQELLRLPSFLQRRVGGQSDQGCQPHVVYVRRSRHRSRCKDATARGTEEARNRNGGSTRQSGL